jgi:hypothetical protein
MTRDELITQLESYEDEITLADGFEAAFIGIGERCASVPVAVYDYQKAVEILCVRDGMGEEEADEFMQFNVLGAYVGEATPWFITWKISRRETAEPRDLGGDVSDTPLQVLGTPSPTSGVPGGEPPGVP